MAICNTVYYDIDGNPSPVYYETLKKEGHEAALKAYIEYMLSTNAKFSTDSMGNVLSVDELITKSAKLRLNADESQYLNETSGNLHNRITNLVKNLKTEPDVETGYRVQKSEFDTDGIALDQARRYIEKEALRIKGYESEDSRPEQLVVDKIYDEFMSTQEEDYLEQVAQTQFKDKWAASAKWGEYFHAVMQQFIVEYNKQVLDVEAKTGKETYVSNSVLLRAARETLSKDKKFKGMVAIQADNMNEIAQKVLNQIHKIVNQEKLRYGEAPAFQLLPELKLSSDNVPGKPAGTADLVMITNHGNAYVFDFKTKSAESALNMNKVGTGKFGGEFESENLFDTPANSARVQMSYYAAILEENGYKVPQTYVIMLPGDMARITNTQSKEREWIYTGMNANKMEIIANPTLHHLLQQDTEATKAMIEQARANGTHKFIMDLASKDDMINLLYTRDNSTGYVQRKKAQINTDDRGKKFFNRDNPDLGRDQRRYYTDDKTDSEIETVLLNDYRQIKEEQKHLANNIIQFFNVEGKHKQHNLGGRETIVANLLGSINRETHTLVRADRYHPSLADVGADVLVAENKLTGAISLLSVMPVLNSSIKFSTDKTDKRTTVFGKYANDKAVRDTRSGSEVIEQNYMHDFASMKLGLAALKLKSLTSKPVLIEEMKVASIVSSDSASITTTYMPKEIAKLQLIRKFAPKEDIPQFVADLLDKPSNVAPAAFGFSYIDHLKKLIAQRQGEFKNKGVIEIGRILEERLQRIKNGDLVSYETLVATSKYRNEVISLLMGLHPGTNVKKMPEVLAIDRAIVQMNQYNINSKQLIRQRLSRQFGRTAMGTGDVLIERSQVLMNTASENVRKDFKKFYDKHDELLREFILENGGNEKKAFALAMMDPDFKSGNEKSWMKLKDANDPSLRNSPATRAYIEYFNSTIEQYYTKLLPSNKVEGFKNGDLWSKGLVPVIRASKSMFDSKSYESISNWTDALKQNVKSMQKANYDPQLANDFEFTGADKFTSQVGNEGVQHSRSREDALGISNNTQNVIPKRDVETNLAAILVNLAVTASEAEHMGNILVIHDALYNVIEDRQESNKDIKAESTVEYLKEWTNMVVKNKYGKEESEPITRYADQVSKMTSTIYFSASIKQAMTEAFTGTFQITSAMLANSLTGLVSKGKTVHFYPSDVAWAAKNLDAAVDVNMQSKGFQIMYDLGMTYADSAQLKQKEWYDVGKAKVFKTRPMFYLNQLFFTSSITLAALAEVHHLGIDKAYINTGTDAKPNWKYDETLDDRFYVYDPENKSLSDGKQTQPPTTEAEKKKYALWKTIREELDKEGMIGDDGAMLLPLTANELTSMKFYSTKLYGSFNKDKTTMAEKSVIGRSMLRYKGWFQQKAANYWTPTDMSIARGKMEWIDDTELEDGGYWKWTGIPHEGILESVGGLMREIAKFKGIPNPTDIQLENLGKLFADLFLFVAMLAPLLAFMKSENPEFFGSTVGKALEGAYSNASSDMAIWKATSTMGDTVFPGIDMALTTAGSAIAAATSLITGDEKAAMKSFLKVPQTVGAYNTFTSASELINSVKS